MKNKKIYFLIFIFSYIFLITFFFTLEKVFLQEVFLNATRNIFLRDISVRRFVAKLGGVYGDINKISPNPYLKLQDREITASNQKTYTLINPAYFIKNVYEIMQKDYGIISRITSPNFLNPNNAPNDIEKEALKKFEKGQKEYYKFINHNGKKTFFYMAPLYVEEGCLLCHKEQGYKLGDLRGGISVYLKSESVMSLLSNINKTGIMIITLIYIIFIYFLLRYNRKIKKYVKEILEKEENFQKIAKKSKSLIIIFDKNGTLKYSNKEINYLRDINFINFQEFLNNFKEEDKKEILEAINRRDILNKDYETKSEIILSINLDYLADNLILFLEDITDQRKYTDFLEYFTNKLSVKSEIEFFNDLNNYITQNLGVDYSFIGTFIPNNKNRIKTISLSFKGKIIDNIEYDLKGTPCENVINKNFCIYQDNVFNLFPEDLFLKEFGIRGYVGTPIFSNDGQVIGIFVLLSEKPIFYTKMVENVVRVVSQKISSDLEKLKVKRTMELIDNILQKSNTGILITDKKFNILYKNENFQEGTFNNLSDIKESWISSFIKDSEKRDNYQIELQEKKKDEIKYYLLNIYKIINQDNEYFLFLKEDITQYKKMEKQLFQAQKMESLGLMISGIIHDFNNILTAILNYANLISLSSQEQDTIKYSEDIKKCVDLSSNLTRDLLIFSRHETSDKIQIDLNVVVNNIYKIFQRTLPRNINFYIKLYPEKIICNLNLSQIEQVLMNIILNAKDAMPDGGNLTIETYIQTLDDMNAKIREYGVISITDTGTGIPAHMLDKVFDPFFTTKEPGKGTGLGLAISYQIVKRHNGFINVYSEENLGTTFKIYLPLKSENESEVRDGKDNLTSLDLKPIKKTVLIIDDEDYILDFLEQFLTKKLECTVIKAKNGKEGLEKFYENIDKIDLIITDFMMPQIDGLELIKAVKKEKENLPIILTTGYGNIPTNKEILQLNNVFQIIKPFSIYKIQECLNKIFNS